MRKYLKSIQMTYPGNLTNATIMHIIELSGANYHTMINKSITTFTKTPQHWHFTKTLVKRKNYRASETPIQPSLSHTSNIADNVITTTAFRKTSPLLFIDKPQKRKKMWKTLFALFFQTGSIFPPSAERRRHPAMSCDN